MIVGYGALGGMILDQLATLGLPQVVTVVGRNAGTLLSRVNTAIAVASIHGHAYDLRWRSCDVLDAGAMAELIDSERPDIILNTACLLPWFEVERLGNGQVRFAEAGRGSIVAIDAIVPYRLMQAVAKASHRPVMINASYPDVVHPALAGIGMAPDIGIGNVANAVPMVRAAASALLEAPVERIDLRFATHHSVSHRIAGAGLSSADRRAYVLRVGLDGVDVTDRVDSSALFELAATRFRRVIGAAGQGITAANAIAVVRAFERSTATRIHAPGPAGLPGGYPVVIYDGRVSIAEDFGFSRGEAIMANSEAHAMDGIRSVSDDGAIEFTDRTSDILKSCLGIDVSKFNISECADIGFEMLDRLKNLRQSPHHLEKIG
jgi:hypothetical protein